MKKLLTLLLALAMVLSLTACGSASNGAAPAASAAPAANESAGADDIDRSADPADFSDWTAQDVMDYFNASVPELAGCEDWFQDHATYWAGFPIDVAAGTWDDEGTIQMEVYTFNPDNPDTTPEEVEEWRQHIIDDPQHGYVTDDIFLMAVSHMIGNTMINYEYTMDEDAYNAIDAAYNNLVSAMNLTPEF